MSAGFPTPALAQAYVDQHNLNDLFTDLVKSVCHAPTLPESESHLRVQLIKWCLERLRQRYVVDNSDSKTGSKERGSKSGSKTKVLDSAGEQDVTMRPSPNEFDCSPDADPIPSPIILQNQNTQNNQDSQHQDPTPDQELLTLLSHLKIGFIPKIEDTKSDLSSESELSEEGEPEWKRIQNDCEADLWNDEDVSFVKRLFARFSEAALDEGSEIVGVDSLRALCCVFFAGGEIDAGWVIDEISTEKLQTDEENSADNKSPDGNDNESNAINEDGDYVPDPHDPRLTVKKWGTAADDEEDEDIDADKQDEIDKRATEFPMDKRETEAPIDKRETELPMVSEGGEEEQGVEGDISAVVNEGGKKEGQDGDETALETTELRNDKTENSDDVPNNDTTDKPSSKSPSKSPSDSPTPAASFSFISNASNNSNPSKQTALDPRGPRIDPSADPTNVATDAEKESSKYHRTDLNNLFKLLWRLDMPRAMKYGTAHLGYEEEDLKNLMRIYAKFWKPPSDDNASKDGNTTAGGTVNAPVGGMGGGGPGSIGGSNGMGGGPGGSMSIGNNASVSVSGMMPGGLGPGGSVSGMPGGPSGSNPMGASMAMGSMVANNASGKLFNPSSSPFSSLPQPPGMSSLNSMTSPGGPGGSSMNNMMNSLTSPQNRNKLTQQQLLLQQQEQLFAEAKLRGPTGSELVSLLVYEREISVENGEQLMDLMFGCIDRGILALLPQKVDFWDWAAILLPAREKKKFVQELVNEWIDTAMTSGLVIESIEKKRDVFPWGGYRGGGGDLGYRGGMRPRWGAMLG